MKNSTLLMVGILAALAMLLAGLALVPTTMQQASAPGWPGCDFCGFHIGDIESFWLEFWLD